MQPNFTLFLISVMIVICFHRVMEIINTRKEKLHGKIYYKWTFKVLASIHVLTGLFSVLEYLIVKREINYLICFFGISIFIMASILRNRAITQLSRFHSIHIEIRDTHQLIKSGIYSYLRNPYYTSVCFEVPSLALIANAYFAFYFALLFYLPFVFIRAYLEEKVMINKFGEEFLSYKKQVHAYLPSRTYLT